MKRIAGFAAMGALLLGACTDSSPEATNDLPTPSTTAVGSTSDDGSELTVTIERTGGTEDSPLAVAAPADPVVARFASLTGAGSLQAFGECQDLLDYVKEQAAGRVGPYGLDGGGYYYGEERFAEVGMAIDDVAADSPASEEDLDSGVGGVDFSTTNVQEEGVDEPDTVKTDGTRLVTIVNGSVHVLDVTGDDPVLQSSTVLPSGYNHELLLNGDRVFVLSGDGAYAIDALYAEEDVASDSMSMPSDGEVTVIQELDISNPSNPTIESTQVIDGRYITARVVDGVARVVVTSRPSQLPFVSPSGGPGSEELARQTNEAVVAASTIDDWLPSVMTINGQGQVVEEQLVDCTQIGQPEEFAGFGLLSVVSVDLSESLDVSDVVSVMTEGEVVYGSSGVLYVATTAWVDPLISQQMQEEAMALASEGVEPDEIEELLREEFPDQVDSSGQTSIHKFSLVDGSASYVASGSVPGRLLDQFAMSEFEGVLRVASTAGTTWDATSESFVTTLTEVDGALVQQGQVGDLGLGEEIYAVRMIEDKGYVVTFRQVDPLYVIDLSDPANPTTQGELKIPGYSSYLHAVGEDLLLGVGQDADEETGSVLGAQVSLFDVSDPANPVRIDQMLLGSGSIQAEWDHRAFLFWAPENLAVLPVDLYDYNIGTSQFTGAIALDLESRSLVEAGRVAHPAAQQCYEEYAGIDEQGVELTEEYCYADSSGQISRSMVIGDDLLTFSAGGVGINDLETLASEGHIAYAG